MKEIILEKTLVDQVGQIGSADILVGIPSYNNARTIGHVVRAVQAGLVKYFPGYKAVLLNSDGGSSDQTMQMVRDTNMESAETYLITHSANNFFKIATPYHGIPGKGSAFRTIFETAKRLNVKACCVVDSDLRSITPEWIELLLKPVLESDFDYVAPMYMRHKFDGTITNSIIYPLTRALYGMRIRQPIGGEFGFSGQLAGFFLDQDVWESDVARFGIDIWMTTTAVANSFKVCQSFLGAKIHDAKDPGVDLSSMLYQVVSAAFDLMSNYVHEWKKITESKPVPTFGFQYAVGLEPIAVNVNRLIDKFNLGVKDLTQIWEIFLPPEVAKEFTLLQNVSKSDFHISDEIWARTIFSFASAYNKKTINREHLLKSLTPLYLGRTASFILEVWDCNAEEVEERLDRLCVVYEKEKLHFIDHWS